MCKNTNKKEKKKMKKRVVMLIVCAFIITPIIVPTIAHAKGNAEFHEPELENLKDIEDVAQPMSLVCNHCNNGYIHSYEESADWVLGTIQCSKNPHYQDPYGYQEIYTVYKCNNCNYYRKVYKDTAEFNHCPH